MMIAEIERRLVARAGSGSRWRPTAGARSSEKACCAATRGGERGGGPAAGAAGDAAGAGGDRSGVERLLALGRAVGCAGERSRAPAAATAACSSAPTRPRARRLLASLQGRGVHAMASSIEEGMRGEGRGGPVLSEVVHLTSGKAKGPGLSSDGMPLCPREDSNLHGVATTRP